ncbi:MAG TPA: hypothetical protein PKD67_00335 [Ignavibacteriaceae bacterium]|nr:hypothetical protein [Ignavibacteriaceae bacterium]
MSDLQFDSDSSGLLSKNFSAENNLNNGGEFDKQLDTIITKKGKLIKYLSVVYFLGIVISTIYFFFS